MANTKLTFFCETGDGASMECSQHERNIVVSILCGDEYLDILLDIPTAIKFAKTVRTEINIAKLYDDKNWLDGYIKEEGSNE
jgi:hypothetical protein